MRGCLRSSLLAAVAFTASPVVLRFAPLRHDSTISPDVTVHETADSLSNATKLSMLRERASLGHSRLVFFASPRLLLNCVSGWRDRPSLPHSLGSTTFGHLPTAHPRSLLCVSS